MGIFKAYDIRGIYGDDLTDEVAYRIGRAAAIFLREKYDCREIFIGHDARESSPDLKKALIEGILDEDMDVVDGGEMTTPMMYYCVIEKNYKGGIMITASHNPKEYNGFKIVGEKAYPIGGSTGLKDIERISMELGEKKIKGKLREENYRDEYINFLKSNLVEGNKRIVVDFGNGMAALNVPKLFEGTKYNMEYLYDNVDCTFPNHEANPSKVETLKKLVERVKETNADMGFAFDGDGDRFALVSDDGTIVPGDITLAAIADYMLEKKMGNKVLYEVRSSWVVREIIEKHGATPVLWKAGHSNIKIKMMKDDIFLGGEKSGHIFYKSLGFVDSAEYTMLMILKIFQNKKVSEIIQPLMKYHNSGEINFKVKDPDSILNKIKEKYREGKIKEIDGVTIEFNDWWFNLRKSNTEPLVRLNLEAKRKELVDEKVDEIKKIIENEG